MHRRLYQKCYLSGSNRSRSTIVLEAFEDEVARYQIRMKVRSDFGGENILVANPAAASSDTKPIPGLRFLETSVQLFLN